MNSCRGTCIKYEGRWLKIGTKTYSYDGNQTLLEWEFVERSTRSCEVDGVDVLSFLTSKEYEEPHLLLIENFRVPLRTYCIELPAGLIEKGEPIEKSASRELKEETGYTPEAVFGRSPVIYYSPGISNENGYIYRAVIDMDKEENKSCIQKLDEDEMIRVRNVPVSQLQPYLQDCLSKGYKIEGKIMFALLGILLREKYHLGECESK